MNYRRLYTTLLSTIPLRTEQRKRGETLFAPPGYRYVEVFGSTRQHVVDQLADLGWDKALQPAYIYEEREEAMGIFAGCIGMAFIDGHLTYGALWLATREAWGNRAKTPEGYTLVQARADDPATVEALLEGRGWDPDHCPCFVEKDRDFNARDDLHDSFVGAALVKV